MEADARAAGIEVRVAAAGDRLGDHPVPAGALVAFAGGELVGVAEFHTRFFGHLFIELLLVAARHRRRGVASALIAACAAAAPTDRLFTSTNASNLAAQSLFLRSGFQVSGSIDNLDEGDPEIVYCRLLDRPASAPEPGRASAALPFARREEPVRTSSRRP